MKVYIAGPMRGIPAYNFPAFAEAAAAIRASGYGNEVLSPHEADIMEDNFDPMKDQPKDMRHYMKRDLPALLDCDAICLLDGWEKSVGATLEKAVADACGLMSVRLGKCGLEPLAKPESGSILSEAIHLVAGARQAYYGPPEQDFARTCGMAKHLGIELDPHQFAMLMVLVKLSRAHQSPGKRDHWVDIAGYAECGWRAYSKTI